MDAGLLAQHVLVALAVFASGAYVFVTRFPRHARRLRGHVALRLVDSGRPRLARWGRRLAPAAVRNGCGGCDGCDA